MKIEVVNPSECPFRYFESEFRCSIVRETFGDMECSYPDEWPANCLLLESSVTVKKGGE